MNEQDCPFCKGATDAYVAAADINRRVGSKVFHLRRCSGCGLIYLSDPPDDLTPYWPQKCC